MYFVFDVLASLCAAPKQTPLLLAILFITESRGLLSIPFPSLADNEIYQMHASVFCMLAALILICNKII